MFVKKVGPLAVLIVLSWFAPQAAAFAIHAHELLEHAHHGAAEAGLAFHDDGHDHEMPSVARDVAPPVRMGKQKPTPAPALTALPPVPLDIPERPVASVPLTDGRPGPREGPPLPILHCSFLI